MPYATARDASSTCLSPPVRSEIISVSGRRTDREDPKTLKNQGALMIKEHDLDSSLTQDAFVQRSIEIMLGRSLEKTSGLVFSEDALFAALKSSSHSAVGRLGPEAPLQNLAPDGMDCSTVNVPEDSKNGLALSQIADLGARFSYVVDMQDRRVKRLVLGSCAVFSFNRLASDPQRILWPLTKYHSLGETAFLGGLNPQAIAWERRHPQMVWRGAATGRTAPAGEAAGIRIKTAIRKFKSGRMRPGRFARLLNANPRARAVRQVFDDQRFNFGLVDGGGQVISRIPPYASLERNKMTPAEMQRYRYIAVLPGMDVGSSFYWTMNSGSLGFVMESPFETFASGHFRPWEHYVPIREDLSDLSEAFDWAEAHPDEASAIAARAATVCKFLARPDLRIQVLQGVIERINNHLPRPVSSS